MCCGCGLFEVGVVCGMLCCCFVVLLCGVLLWLCVGWIVIWLWLVVGKVVLFCERSCLCC